MTAIFIADLHLEEARPEIAAIFFRFLQKEARNAQALYILGDLFEVWIGDDDNSTFNQGIIQALRQTVRLGTQVYIMRGNRDFLLGRRFQREAACQLLPDTHKIKVGGEATLLMHGDTLCTLDEKYLRFRKKSRNFFVQKLFLLKSLAKRRELAQSARRMSADHTKNATPEIMDVTPSEVERVMLKHRVRRLIHGHTHRPAVHEFQLASQRASRIVLAPWHVKGSALVFHADGRQEFLELC